MWAVFLCLDTPAGPRLPNTTSDRPGLTQAIRTRKRPVRHTGRHRSTPPSLSHPALTRNRSGSGSSHSGGAANDPTRPAVCHTGSLLSWFHRIDRHAPRSASNGTTLVQAAHAEPSRRAQTPPTDLRLLTQSNHRSRTCPLPFTTFPNVNTRSPSLDSRDVIASAKAGRTIIA